MASPANAGDREKVVSKLPGWLRQDLKIRSAQLGIEIQGAVEEGLAQCSALASAPTAVDTSGAHSCSTCLPPSTARFTTPPIHRPPPAPTNTWRAKGQEARAPPTSPCKKAPSATAYPCCPAATTPSPSTPASPRSAPGKPPPSGHWPPSKA